MVAEFKLNWVQDTHFHFFQIDPCIPSFPLSPTRHFTPSPVPLSAYFEWANILGIDHGGLTHGLSFGNDLSSLEYYLDKFASGRRAFAVVDLEKITDAEIKALHAKVSADILFLTLIAHQYET